MEIFYLALGIVFIIAGILALYFQDKRSFDEKGMVMSIFYLVFGVITLIINFFRLYPRDRKYFFQKYRKRFPQLGIFLLFLIGLVFIRLSF